MDKTETPNLPGLHVETGYDNSNPADPAAIQVAPDGRFMASQYLEPDAPPGYSFHLNVAFVNEGDRPTSVPIRIQWGERQFDFCRDHLYVGYDNGSHWQMIACSSHAGVSELSLIVPPGRHLLCVTPVFTYGDYLACLAEFEGHDLVESVEVGESHEGRRLACLRIGTAGAPRFVVTTRAHGYETAGAFCIRGWLRKVVANPGACREILDNMELFLFPMINPDAAAAGTCCLAPTGVNFGRDLAVSGDRDRGAATLCKFVYGLEPEFLLDIHNHTGQRQIDSFRSSSQELVDAFNAVAPDDGVHQKTWQNYAKKYTANYLSGACEERFGTVRCLTEFPWYTRVPADMEDFGARFFDALLPLLLQMKQNEQPGKEANS